MIKIEPKNKIQKAIFKRVSQMEPFIRKSLEQLNKLTCSVTEKEEVVSSLEDIELSRSMIESEKLMIKLAIKSAYISRLVGRIRNTIYHCYQAISREYTMLITTVDKMQSKATAFHTRCKFEVLRRRMVKEKADALIEKKNDEGMNVPITKVKLNPELVMPPFMAMKSKSNWRYSFYVDSIIDLARAVASGECPPDFIKPDKRMIRSVLDALRDQFYCPGIKVNVDQTGNHGITLMNVAGERDETILNYLAGLELEYREEE